MFFTTHLLSTIIIINAFSPLTFLEKFFCFLFGVLIDLDEIAKGMMEWRKTKNFSEFSKRFLKRGAKRRTWLQECGGLFLALIISFMIKSFLPFFCGITHCILDWVSYYSSNPLKPFNKIETRGFIKTLSIEEFLLTLFLVVVLVYT
ncbi:MAG: hypothetical protein QXO84_03605 [Candidatus Aenigmatarchaeota archaeon]